MKFDCLTLFPEMFVPLQQSILERAQKNGNIDKEAIKQDIKTLLLMWVTEYPFNTNQGLNWYQLSQYNNKNDIIIAVKDRILQDKRILNVNSIDVS